MFGLSVSHLLILLVIVLIFGGARRLPELGSALGKGLRAFRKGLDGGPVDESQKIENPETSETHASSDKTDKKS